MRHDKFRATSISIARFPTAIFRRLSTKRRCAVWEVPKMIADVVVDAEIYAVAGALDSNSREPSRLIVRPATTLEQAV